jgi:hypothetical protein
MKTWGTSNVVPENCNVNIRTKFRPRSVQYIWIYWYWLNVFNIYGFTDTDWMFFINCWWNMSIWYIRVCYLKTQSKCIICKNLQKCFCMRECLFKRHNLKSKHDFSILRGQTSTYSSIKRMLWKCFLFKKIFCRGGSALTCKTISYFCIHEEMLAVPV